MLELKDTILLKTLYAIFSKIKRAEYGSSMEIREGFVAEPEKVFYAFQKEFLVWSKVGKN